ncbi:hypothetical protein [Deinococcus marmoris]|uniref:hypothetical protein n=1 Tax=Deinococcus marmoris TaxID=249408 RepID=UPI00096AA3B6|nr:hypothetical protein [Deinococcus marmoris]
MDNITDTADVRTGWKAKNPSKAKEQADKSEETAAGYAERRRRALNITTGGVPDWLDTPAGQAWQAEQRAVEHAAARSERQRAARAERGGRDVQRLDLGGDDGRHEQSDEAPRQADPGRADAERDTPG